MDSLEKTSKPKTNLIKGKAKRELNAAMWASEVAIPLKVAWTQSYWFQQSAGKDRGVFSSVLPKSEVMVYKFDTSYIKSWQESLSSFDGALIYNKRK